MTRPIHRLTRRAALGIGALGLATPAILSAQGMMGGGHMGGGAGALPTAGAPFRLLPLRETAEGALTLTATSGETRFGRAGTPTMGYDGTYLGPTLRLRRGRTVAARVSNATNVPVSTHWHGLNVPSDADGGAMQSVIAPGGTWDAALPVDQSAATLWYHTHVHGRTAPDLWAGLAGAIIVEDEASDALGLPSEHGVDDLVLILQDKRFDADGRAIYDPGMMEIMHGHVGDAVLANGQFAPVAQVPAGLVRLRLINAATSAEHRIAFPGGAQLIGVDQGLLPAPVAVADIVLAPGERAEIVVEVAPGAEVAPMIQANSVGGGMGGTSTPHPLIHLRADDRRGAGRLRDRLAPDPEPLPEPVAARTFTLQENMGPVQMVRHASGLGARMTINDAAYDPDRIDFTPRRGTVERWVLETDGMAHPFHAHGVKMRVLGPTRPEEAGWKDVVTVAGRREVLALIEGETRRDVPFMFHCHILEHEDAGMMGQFMTA